MTKHYDAQIEDKLCAQKTFGEIVLNPHFQQWTDNISTNLKTRTSLSGTRYESGEDNELLHVCRAHAKTYQKGKLEGDKIIAFTHPFYVHLTHMARLKSETVRREVDEYLDMFLNFLFLNRGTFKVPVVVFETVHHYAAATSLLLERGLVDLVIFTVYDWGKPLVANDIQHLEKGTIFFGGGYNGKCLRASIETVTEMRSSNKDLWAIKEFVLNAPYDYPNTLRTSSVEGIQSAHVIALEDILPSLL